MGNSISLQAQMGLVFIKLMEKKKGAPYENLNSAFIDMLYSYKLVLAMQIAEKYPSFQSIVETIRINNTGIGLDQSNFLSTLTEEYLELGAFEDILGFMPEYLVLKAAMYSFLIRAIGGPDQRVDDPKVHVMKVANILGDLVTPRFSLQTYLLFHSALWFSNYENYAQELRAITNRE